MLTNMNGVVVDDYEDADYDENRERREAEFEMIRAAYSPEEAWVVGTNSKNKHDSDSDSDTALVCRKLKLPIEGCGDNATSASSCCVLVDLVLALPSSYPTDEKAILRVDASLSHAGDKPAASSSRYRKAAIDALPDLLKVCRGVALEHAGSESVFVVLSEAETWIHEQWPSLLYRGRRTVEVGQRSEILSSATSSNNYQQSHNAATARVVVLGRKLIHSHHIIAKSKRRAIHDLAKEFELGGCFKIGWPGIIVIEGREEDCESFYTEIRKLRWQHLVLRGEESEEVADADASLDGLRRLPKTMTELGEDQMSRLAEICRGAGLEDLFRTSMKMYKQDESNASNNGDETNGASKGEKDHRRVRYGTLILVDHMNDPKGYTKWIQNACKSTGSSFFIGRCFPNDGNDYERSDKRKPKTPKSRRRPIIIVGLIGDDESSPKMVLKRWRTSRVDVDSKGNPCLERMMSVLVEGPLVEAPQSLSETVVEPTVLVTTTESAAAKGGGDKKFAMTPEELESSLATIGGSPWAEAFREVLRERTTSHASKRGVAS